MISSGAPRAGTGPRANSDIVARHVRLISETGENLGVVLTEEALRRSEDVGLDLVEIVHDPAQPVCKIMDLGKHKYENQKRKNEAKKKQKNVEIKELKFRPGINEHDYEVKMRAMTRFLEEGDKVKVTLRFRGREMAHQDLGMDVLRRIQDNVATLAKVEQTPKMEGRQMVMVVAPAR